LKEQFPRHCFIKVHDQKTQPMLVPFIKHFYTSPKNLKWYEERVLSKIRARKAEDVDSEILQSAAANARTEEPTSSERPSRQKGKTTSARWQDLIGRE
jgi:hypothetical protein